MENPDLYVDQLNAGYWTLRGDGAYVFSSVDAAYHGNARKPVAQIIPYQQEIRALYAM